MTMEIATVEATEFFGLPAWKLNSRTGASAVITERGATLISWEPSPGANIIAGYNSAEELNKAVAARSRVMAPWAGRIANNTYTFNGKEYDVSGNGANGLHGQLADKDFVAASVGETLTLAYHAEPNEAYPWSYDISVNYSLDAGAEGEEHLSMSMQVTNTSGEDAPLMLGWHPYVKFPESHSISNLSLMVPGRVKILKDAQMVPRAGESAYAGVKAPYVIDYLGGIAEDSSFRDLIPDSDGVVTTTLRDPVSNARIELTQEPGDAPVVHVFTADGLPRDPRKSIALEPMSHLADAFNRPDQAAKVILGAGKTRYMTATLTYRH